MFVVIHESKTIREVMRRLFQALDPDYPFDGPAISSPTDMTTLSSHSPVSIPVAKKLIELLEKVMGVHAGYLDWGKAFKSSEEEEELSTILLEDDHLISVLLSGWEKINVLDNRGTFTLTYPGGNNA